MKKNFKDNLWTFIFIGVFGVLVTLAVYGAMTQKHDKTEVSQFPTTTKKEFKEDEQPTVGDKDAKHTITVYFDYLCPHCAEWEKNEFPKIEKELIKTKKARVMFVNYAFMSQASYSAAMAAEFMHKNHPESFLEFHNTLFENSRTLSNDYIVKLAKQVQPKLDTTALENALKQNKLADDVLSDKAHGSKLGIDSTPSVLVDGTKTASATIEEIKTLIK
ncbi:DsbA family protein [Bacillus bombysepticus]|uniref:DsbA family protein n=1 Tax=Bacillus bombysepticus TaxID=658666 RepID=UPI003017C149